MDLSIKDWLMVIGVLLLLAVALDGYRRARNERKNQVKLSKNAKRSARNHKSGIDDEYDDHCPDVSTAKTYESDDIGESYKVDPLFEDPFDVEKTAFEMPQEPLPDTLLDDQANEDTLIEEAPLRAFEKDKEAFVEPLDKPEAFTAEPEEIIVLNVMAQSGQILSPHKLKAVLDACDCRFQANGVFYRFEKEHGRGDIQFSVVNMVEPGTFGNSQLDRLQTPGVSFLLCLPGPENPTEAINCMIETAQCVAHNLAANIKDENLCVVTEQQLEYHRQRIRNFLQRKLLGSANVG